MNSKDPSKGMRKDASDFRKLFKRLRHLGWHIEHTRGDHVKLTSPDGQVIILALTASTGRSLRFLRSRIRKLERR